METIALRCENRKGLAISKVELEHCATFGKYFIVRTVYCATVWMLQSLFLVCFPRRRKKETHRVYVINP